MRKLFYAFAGVAVIAFSACNMNYKTTKSGLKYKIFAGKATDADTTGIVAAAGTIVKFNLKYIIPERKDKDGKDTVLRDSYGTMPLYGQVDTSERSQMSIMEIIPMMKAGDSAIVTISADSIMAKSPQGGSFLKKGEHIQATISLLNVFANDSAARADVTKEQTKQTAKDAVKLDAAGAALNKYIADKGIKAIKTKSGIYIVLDNPGDITAKADSGMEASVLYTGKLLDGKIFDTNLDSTFKDYHAGAIKVDVGSHRTISGWDEALPYFAKGAKGTIYIPAKMGYGAQQAGPNIPAYSNLVFDIQVQDVKKSEAPKPQTQMTPEMQKQLQEQIQKQMQAQKGAAH